MSAKPFLDTNVIVYAFTKDDPRSKRADALLRAGGINSVQVLNELVGVSRRKLGLDWTAVERQRGVLFELLEPPIPLTLALHQMGVTLMQRYGFSIYDSLVIAAALQAQCPLLYSEDMQHGQVIEGMTIHNPFV